jgi:Carbohydrate family 9 binding domain-like/Calcineurin-like phosphoesterase
MAKAFKVHLVLVLAWLLVATAPAAAEDSLPTARPAPWTSREFNDSPRDFHFAIVGDRAGGTRPGVFERALARVELMQPAFALCVGDLVEGNTQTEADLVDQFAEVDRLLDALSMPFFRVTGNHDIGNSPWGIAVWKERYGPLYYHFRYNDVLFLCLSSDEGGSRNLSDEQAAYAERIIAENPDVRWTFVFVHHPLWTYETENNWDRVEAALGDRPYTVFAGHTHEYLKYDRLERDYFVIATSGGGSGAHEGFIAGEFDHIVWVSMIGGTPHVANLLLDGIKGKNVRTDSSTALLEPLLAGEAISVSGLEVNGDSFSRGSARFTLRNPARIPLRVLGALCPNAQMRPAPARIETTVPPLGEATFNVDLTADSPVTSRDLLPLSTQWRLRYDQFGEYGLETTYALQVCPTMTYTCPRHPVPVTVDGDLDEWPGRPLRCLTPAQVLPNGENWRGAGDCSFDFDTAYDEENVYVRVSVVDDVPVYDAGRRPWKQDGVQIRLDARPDPQRSAGRGEEDRKQTRHLFVAVSPSETPDAPNIHGAEGLPDALKLACSRTASGYALEMAIPLSYLGAMQEGQTQAFRLNVTVSDYDSPVDTGAEIWWRPNWARNENMPGSGTFHLVR